MNQIKQQLIHFYFLFAIFVIGTAGCSPTTKNKTQEDADVADPPTKFRYRKVMKWNW